MEILQQLTLFRKYQIRVYGLVSRTLLIVANPSSTKIDPGRWRKQIQINRSSEWLDHDVCAIVHVRAD
jgi:hypothetical protein